ncbi:hypothetical protein ACJMK2_020100 [Sinanodonta woodiana]|uniref:Serine/arginine-rich splicing factor 7 n=1 Tax=Sinanodonta woodiana TaxID=1069815 RepID=A0ABD3U0Q3_SINWO
MGRSRSRSRSYSRDRYSNSGSDSRSRSSSPEGHRIHVADLGLDPSKAEVERQFERFGPLIEVWVAKNPPCFAFVVYKYKEDAEKAIQDMDGKVIGGSRIRVSYARPRTKGRRRRGFDPNLRCYQCGERGHFSRDCDEIWRQRRKNRDRERRSSRKSPPKSKSHSHSRSRSGSRHRKSRSRSQSQSKRSRKESDKSKSEKKSKSHDRSKDKESSKSPQHKKSASKSPREKASSSKSSKDKETSKSPRALDPETSGSRSPAQQQDVASEVKEHQDLPPPAEKMSSSGSPDDRRSVTPDDRSRSRSPYKRSRSKSPAPDSRSPEHEMSPINGEGDDYL